MALRRMWDAAWPPSNPPAWEAVAGYIGGNTPHVWTDAEWAASGARYRLPIFVRSSGGDPDVDAARAAAWLRAHDVPQGCAVALDFETRVDAGYLHAFDQVVVAAGWRVVLYGSKTAVLQNPKPSGGYWAAHWTNTPHLCGEPGVTITQYGGDTTLGQPYDASVVADSVPLWDTQAKEADMPLSADDLAAIDLKVKQRVDAATALVLRGDATHPDSLKAIRADVAAVDGGAPISDAQLALLADRLAPLVAGRLEVAGHPTYTGTVEISPKVAT